MIKNMTPHPVNIVDQSGKVVKIFESVGQIRLASQIVEDAEIDGVPTSQTVFGEAVGLPEEHLGWCGVCSKEFSDFGYFAVDDDDCPDCGQRLSGTYYIVSQIVKSALLGRTDLLVPAEVVRDASGNIIGCRSLGR